MARQIKSTMVELVEELQKLRATAEQTLEAALDVMIHEAKAGEYHDYKNNKYACGKMESAMRLDNLGYSQLASRIKNGEFDEEADEDDKAAMRKTCDAEGVPKKFQEEMLGL